MKTYGYLPYLALAMLFSVALYYPTLSHEFVWDDLGQVVYNSAFESPLDFKTHFLDPNVTGGSQDAQIYRPVRNVLFSLQYLVFGHTAEWYHLWNILLHAINTCLWGMAYLRLFRIKRTHALILGLIFLVHPLATEVVCWAKGGEDLYATVFTLLCLLCWQRLREIFSIRQAIACVCALTLAVYTKESTLFLPLLLVAEKTFYRHIQGRVFVYAIGLVTLSFLYLRFTVLNQWGQIDYLGGSVWHTQLGMSHIYADFLYKLGLPFDLQINFMGMDTFSGGYFRLWALWVFLVTVVAACWTASGFRPVVMAVLSLLPVSNIVPMMQWGAERFLYVPLGFFIVCLYGLITKYVRLSKRAGYILLGGWILSLVVGNVLRQGIWENNRTLGMEMLRKNPYSYHGLYLALEHDKQQGNFERLSQMSGEYLQKFPNEERLYHYYAFSLMAKNDFNGAMKIIEAGLLLFKDSKPLHEWKVFIEDQVLDVGSGFQ